MEWEEIIIKQFKESGWDFSANEDTNFESKENIDKKLETILLSDIEISEIMEDELVDFTIKDLAGWFTMYIYDEDEYGIVANGWTEEEIDFNIWLSLISIGYDNYDPITHNGEYLSFEFDKEFVEKHCPYMIHDKKFDFDGGISLVLRFHEVNGLFNAEYNKEKKMNKEFSMEY